MVWLFIGNVLADHARGNKREIPCLNNEDVLNQYSREERPSDFFLRQLCSEALNPKDVKTTSKSRAGSILAANPPKERRFASGSPIGHG
jgi:hypothetical protein